MSEMSQDSLEMKLDQLECHFTWDLNKDDLDLHNLPSRLQEQVRLDLSGAARALCSIGYVKFLLEHTQEALTNLLESERLVKENLGDNCEKSLIVTYGNLAWVYFHRENFLECQSYLEKLEEIKETLQTEPVPEVLHEKGWAFLKFSQKYYPQAVEVFQKAVERDPYNSELNAGYAIALYRTEPGISCTVDSPAVNQLRRAIDLNPNDGVLKVLLAIKLLSCPKSFMNEAEKLVETALNESPDHPDVLKYAAIFYRDHGSVDSAIEILKKALKSTNSYFIHHQLGVCYKTKKIILNKEKQDKSEIDKARNQSIYHLEMATQLKPSCIVAMSALAVQYGERRELDKAEELFRKAFETAEKNNEHLNTVDFDYAQFQLYSKRCEDLAIKHYKQCLTMYPRTGESKKSAWNLKKIADKRKSCNPDDQTAKEILGLLQLTVEKHLKHNPNGVQETSSAMTVDIPQTIYKNARGDDATIPCKFTPQPPDSDIQISWTASPDVPGDPQISIVTYRSSTGFSKVQRKYKGRVMLLQDISKGKADLQLLRTANADTRTVAKETKKPTTEKPQIKTEPSAGMYFTRLPPSPPICLIQGVSEYYQNINLTCRSEKGSPPPTYKWQRLHVACVTTVSQTGSSFMSPLPSWFTVFRVRVLDCIRVVVFVSVFRSVPGFIH
ncbi:interferon-induced protein with tetratricopeptide repeats 5-like [Chanodichthys erythropterus]|uniref:interferon-induced protein with tetratricopeptide repeats 5-like n=1 Tax=Chanodichthys erythropterus TaxID=933992 RepID=UPI00351EFB18